MKPNTLSITILLVLSLACSKEKIPLKNSILEGTYEVKKLEIYHYYSEYTNLEDTIIIDSTISTFSWEVSTAATDNSIYIDGRVYRTSQLNKMPFSFSRLETDDTPYGNYLIESSEVSFFPEKDSFYMKSIFPDDTPADIEKVGDTIFEGKRN